MESSVIRRSAVAGLAVLIGAGISISSGLPSWGELLHLLAVKAGFTEEECRALAELDYGPVVALRLEVVVEKTGFANKLIGCVIKEAVAATQGKPSKENE